MKKILLIVVCLLACDSAGASSKPHHVTLSYYKDSRTNLCFAGHSLGGTAGLFTSVPCTPEVEALVEPFPFWMTSIE